MIKHIVAALLTVACVNAAAADAVSLLMPSPVGLILAVRSYVKDQQKIHYVRVESQAKDFDQARRQAFRLASEQVAGTVVLSESELKNSQLTRNEIITYSSGVVDRYQIVNRVDSNNSVRLVVDVWIVENAMAQRLLAKSATERGISGTDLSARADSILDRSRQGDDIFGAVLRDFPQRSFATKTQRPRIYSDAYRNTVIAVDWEVQWDHRYFDAFHEAAKQTGRRPCVVWGCSTTQQFYIQGWAFDSVQKLTAITQHIESVRPTVMTELQDLHRNPVARTCQPLADMNLFVVTGNSHIALNPRHTERGQTTLNLKQNITAMSTVENVRVEVVARSQCRAI